MVSLQDVPQPLRASMIGAPCYASFRGGVLDGQAIWLAPADCWSFPVCSSDIEFQHYRLTHLRLVRGMKDGEPAGKTWVFTIYTVAYSEV